MTHLLLYSVHSEKASRFVRQFIWHHSIHRKRTASRCTGWGFWGILVWVPVLGQRDGSCHSTAAWNSLVFVSIELIGPRWDLLSDWGSCWHCTQTLILLPAVHHKVLDWVHETVSMVSTSWLWCMTCTQRLRYLQHPPEREQGGNTGASWLKRTQGHSWVWRRSFLTTVV